MPAQRRIDLIVESVRRLLRVGATSNLLNLLQKQHPADLAQIYARSEKSSADHNQPDVPLLNPTQMDDQGKGKPHRRELERWGATRAGASPIGANGTNDDQGGGKPPPWKLFIQLTPTGSALGSIASLTEYLA